MTYLGLAILLYSYIGGAVTGWYLLASRLTLNTLDGRTGISIDKVILSIFLGVIWPLTGIIYLISRGRIRKDNEQIAREMVSDFLKRKESASGGK